MFIKFFIFGEAPSADERASARAAARRNRTLSHTRQRTLSTALRPRPSLAASVLKPRTDGGLTVQKILEKTYYNVNGHQPESLDWFNVLIAQTIAQLRADAQEDEAVLGSLNQVLNGPGKPSFVDEIKVTEISLGDEFPIFSNCRVIPVDENGVPLKELTGSRGERLQARMDVDLGDVVTLGIETKLVLNYPKPFVMVLPVALAVSVVRFSGTLSLSFSPSSQEINDGHPLNPTGHSPTTLTFTFLDDYRLDLSVHSLIGSRSRLQDVPKIAQLVEGRIHQWFDERCVEPRFQQIVLPSLWPRKKNTRGGGDDETVIEDGTSSIQKSGSSKDPLQPLHVAKTERDAIAPIPDVPQTSKTPGRETTAEQRTRDWAAQHSGTASKQKSEMTELEKAGQEMREADERERKKQQSRAKASTTATATTGRESNDARLRTIRETSYEGGSGVGIRASS